MKSRPGHGYGQSQREDAHYYWQSVDWQKLMHDYPPPPLFERTTGRISADELRSLQNERFMARVAEAWEIPFYRERWRSAGLQPGDIRSLDDIEKIPMFNSDDLRAAIAEAPPFGSHHPISRSDFWRAPTRILTSGGTTGLPRATLFDTVALEVQGIQTARALYAQGLRAGDVLQITYTNALSNAAWCAYQGAFHWLGAVPLTTGSGQVTPSEKQLEYAKAWHVNAWWTRGEYLARLAVVAQQMGFDLRELGTKCIHSHLGPDIEGHLRKQLEDAWNAPVYDNYGSHEIGLVAFECQAKDRKHISEDTVFLEIADVDSGEILGAETRGNVVATSLHRSVPPIIRYNMRDCMMLYEREPCACGLETRKLSTFLGRSDEMIKLRGMNVYPLSCQNAVTKDPRTTGEFLCVASHIGEKLNRREHLVVRVERRSPDIDATQLTHDLEIALHKDLSVRVDVEIVEANTLAEFTGLGHQNKVKRLLDLRNRKV